MSTNDLKKELDKALTDFSEEIHGKYAEGSKTPATEGDINELGRQTFYVLDQFKDALIKYLNSK